MRLFKGPSRLKLAIRALVVLGSLTALAVMALSAGGGEGSTIEPGEYSGSKLSLFLIGSSFELGYKPGVIDDSHCVDGAGRAFDDAGAFPKALFSGHPEVGRKRTYRAREEGEDFHFPGAGRVLASFTATVNFTSADEAKVTFESLKEAADKPTRSDPVSCTLRVSDTVRRR